MPKETQVCYEAKGKGMGGIFNTRVTARLHEKWKPVKGHTACSQVHGQKGVLYAKKIQSCILQTIQVLQKIYSRLLGSHLFCSSAKSYKALPPLSPILSLIFRFM